MDLSQIHTQAMYEALKRIPGNKDRQSSIEDGILTVLINKGNQLLIENILEQEDISNIELTEILQAYLNNSRYRDFLSIYKKHSEKLKRYGETFLEEFIVKITKDLNNEEIILEYLKFEKANGNFLKLFKQVFMELLNSNNFNLARKIIDNFLNTKERKIFLLIYKIRKGEKTNNSQISKAINEFINIQLRDGERNYDRKDLITELIKEILNEYNKIGDIRSTSFIISLYEKNKENIGYLDYHTSYRKIRDYYKSNNMIDKLVKFIENSNYWKYEIEYILLAKIDDAINSKNKRQHKRYLTKYLAIIDEKLANIENSDNYSEGFERRKRIDKYRYQAIKYSELAIFELVHGSSSKAQEYIDLMIENTENITLTIPENCSKRNRGHIKGKNKLPSKKRLKERFLKLGLFDKLPTKYGWNKKIKDPQQRSLDREEKKQLKIDNGNNRRIEYDTNETLKLKKILDANNFEGAISFLDKSYYNGRGNWERGILVLDNYPQNFSIIFSVLTKGYFKNEDYGHTDIDYQGMCQFFVKGYILGVVDKNNWDELIGNLFGYQQSYEIANNTLKYMVEYLIDSGNISKAWSFFKEMIEIDEIHNNKRLSYKILSQIIGLFISKTSDNLQLKGDGANIGFLSEFNETTNFINETEELKFWNTKVDIAIAFNDNKLRELAYSRLKNLIINSSNPQQMVRTWSKLIKENNLRNHHQIKDEIQAILSSKIGTIETIRRRLISTMIELEIPGAEASNDLKKKDNPENIQYYYFLKLIEKGYITKKAKIFLQTDLRGHLPNLRKLLALHQNEFNTVVDTLYDTSDVHRNHIFFEEYQRTEIFRLEGFKATEWKNVFKVLEMVGVITPGIWAHAKSINFDEIKLRELAQEIKNAKKKLFKNEPLPSELSIELQAELIYQAYKPVNMSLMYLNDLLRGISDCSHHLDKYIFPQDGYDVSLSQAKEVTFRKNKQANTKLDNLSELIIKKLSKDDIQKIARSLCEIGRFKIEEFESEIINIILQLFDNDDYVTNNILGQYSNNHTKRYKYLHSLKDFLGTYIIDNLQQTILTFFKSNKKQTSVMWNNFVESLNNKKKKTVIRTQLKIEIPKIIDENFAALVISHIILEKSKGLRAFRKQANDEIKNYVNIDGQELHENNIKLKAYVSKNKASFFAKASAGLCTASDKALFNREDHFHINIVDTIKQECVGNLMAYDINHKGERILLLRGFNPNTNLLKEIDIESYCNGMLAIGYEFAKTNGFDGVYMSSPGNFVALSNRTDINNYLLSKYGKSGESCNLSIASSGSIQTIYPLYKFKTQAIAAE